MQRLLAVLLVFSLILFSTGCGNVLVRGVIQPGVSTVSDFVSVVQFTVVDGNVQVTFVTFLGDGTSSTFGFCGDQRRRFPMNQNVRADFNAGPACGNLVTVIVL